MFDRSKFKGVGGSDMSYGRGFSTLLKSGQMDAYYYMGKGTW